MINKNHNEYYKAIYNCNNVGNFNKFMLKMISRRNIMKNLVLTGASDGLGKEFGKLCVENDINVIALCRTNPDYKCDFIKTDLSDEKSVKILVILLKKNIIKQIWW